MSATPLYLEEYTMSDLVQDQWAQWLLHRRHGNDPVQHQAVLDWLYPIRDQVLQNAQLTNGAVVLDVGTGDGLIAFGALAQIGDRGTIIFSDISQDLLDQCRSLVQEIGAQDRCQFLRASADDLTPIADNSVDVITTRSVLIYVTAKQHAFQEFYRVLKPHGRLSIFEPINRFGEPEPDHLFAGYDMTPTRASAHTVRAVYERLLPPHTNPMSDSDERALLTFAEQAGFVDIHLELRAEITRASKTPPWDTLLHTSGNPLEPTLQEVIQQGLTPDEAEQFVAHFRPLVETQQGTRRSATAYLWATKA